jgi:hypothetical protein
MSWSPTGAWLFFARLGPTFGVGVHRPAGARAASLRLDVPGGNPPSMVAL